MQPQHPSPESGDDTPAVAPATTQTEALSEVATDAHVDPVGISEAIEELAGLDPAEAPDLADEVASRLRAHLSER